MKKNGDHSNEQPAAKEMQKGEMTTHPKQSKKKRNYSQTFNVTKEFHKTSNFETVQTYKKGGGTFSLLKFEPLAKLKPTTSNIRIVPKSLEPGSSIQSKEQNNSPTNLSSTPSKADTYTAQQPPFEVNHSSKIQNLSPNISPFPVRLSPQHHLSTSPLQTASVNTMFSQPYNSIQNLNEKNFAISSSSSIYNSEPSSPLQYHLMQTPNIDARTVPSWNHQVSNSVHAPVDRTQSTPLMESKNSSTFTVMPQQSSKQEQLPHLQSSKRRKMDLDFILNKE